MSDVIKTHMIGEGEMVIFMGSDVVCLVSLGELWVGLDEVRI